MSLVRTGTISTLDQVIDKKKYDDNYDMIFGEWKPTGVRARLIHEDRMSVLDNQNSSISVMMKDRVMVRMIRDGKANDRGLKREAERIERENSTRPRKMFREQQQLKLLQLKAELRRSQR